MTEPKRYTLDEARAEMARRECATRGHSWQIVSTFDGYPIRITCDSCGWSGGVNMADRKTS